MNLLPWRTYQHQKCLRRLAFYIALFILLAINLMLAFSNLIEQQKQNLQAQQKSFEQLNQQLHKKYLKISSKPPDLTTLSQLSLFRKTK